MFCDCITHTTRPLEVPKGGVPVPQGASVYICLFMSVCLCLFVYIHIFTWIEGGGKWRHSAVTRLPSHCCRGGPFMPTVPTFAVRETDVSRYNGGTSGGAPLKPVRDDNALRALSSLRGLRGAPAEPPLCRETQSLGQQMLERLRKRNGGHLH